MVLPDPLPSGWSLPSWVPQRDGPICVLLDASALVATPEEPAPEPEPSISPKQIESAVSEGVTSGMMESYELTAAESESMALTAEEADAALLAEVQGLRSLVLYSGGLLIFCMAGLFFRSRRA